MPQREVCGPRWLPGAAPGPAAARAAGGRGGRRPGPRAGRGPAGVPALAAAFLGACEPRCAAPCPLPALSCCRAGVGLRGARGGRPGPRCLRRRLIRKGSFIHKPAHGWLHPDARVLGPGVSYVVRVSASADPGTVLPRASVWTRGFPSPTSLSWTLWTREAGCLSISPLAFTLDPNCHAVLCWPPQSRRRWGPGSHGVTWGGAGRGRLVGGGTHAQQLGRSPPFLG